MLHRDERVDSALLFEKVVVMQQFGLSTANKTSKEKEEEEELFGNIFLGGTKLHICLEICSWAKHRLLCRKC